MSRTLRIEMPKAQRIDPPYMQIGDYYRDQILDGTLTEGDRLPPITALVEEWGVAIATAARAIGQLQIEGYVRTNPKGAFVEPLKAGGTSPRQRMTRVRRTGTTESKAEMTIVRAAELIRPPVYIAELLDVDPDGEVVRRESVTTAGRRPRAEPVALTVQWYAPYLADLIPARLDSKPIPNLIARIEEATGKTLVHGEDHFHGRASDAREAHALALQVGA